MRGSVAVMGLAEQAGLSELIGEKVVLRSTAVRSAGVNPAVKLTSIIAGMAAGADSTDDLQVVRSGGMTQLFTGGTRRRRWASSCASSATGTPGSWGRWPGRIWSTSRRAPRCWPGSTSRPSSTSTRCCARCSATPRAPASGTPRSPADRCCAARPVPAGDHVQHPDRGPGRRPGPAARRAGWLRPGRGLDGHRGDHHRPRRRSGREDPGPAYGNGPVVGACAAKVRPEHSAEELDRPAG